MNPTYVAVVMLDPKGRLVKFLPELAATRAALESFGLFGSQGDLTHKGRVFHWIVTEINPRRAFARAVDEMALRLKWRLPEDRQPHAREIVEQALDELLKDGLIESDERYKGKRGRSFKLRA